MGKSSQTRSEQHLSWRWVPSDSQNLRGSRHPRHYSSPLPCLLRSRGLKSWLEFRVRTELWSQNLDSWALSQVWAQRESTAPVKPWSSKYLSFSRGLRFPMQTKHLSHAGKYARNRDGGLEEWEHLVLDSTNRRQRRGHDGPHLEPPQRTHVFQVHSASASALGALE